MASAFIYIINSLLNDFIQAKYLSIGRTYPTQKAKHLINSALFQKQVNHLRFPFELL